MPDIDAKKIEELRGLLAKATPGPWEVRYSPRTTEECIVVGPRPETMGYAPCILAEDYTGFGEWPVREADHLLVAAMRNALPALLDLAERASFPLAGDVDELCARLDQRAVCARAKETATALADAIHFKEAAALIRSLARALEEVKGSWQPISALWSKPAECDKGCPPRQVCDFCQRELFLGWNGDYVELWNTTNYYTCRERSEPHWKHMAEEAARLTHFMAFDMPDRARAILEPGHEG